MRPGALTLGVIVSAALLAAAGALYFVSDSTGERHYRTSISLVRGIEQLSSNWSIEIARVKSDPFSDFDSLAAFLPRMARLKERLSDTARRIPDLPDRVATDLNMYLHAVAAKEERIERFKTGYAVLRNSTRYLPLAATNVTQQAREGGEEALVRSVSRFIQDMSAYLAAPTETSQRRLGAVLQGLREASVSYPPPLSNALVNLIAHAEVLLDKQGPTEELFREATSSDISELTDQLAANFEFELGKKEVLARYYERGVMGVIALLALFWVGLALQQRTRGAGGTGEAAVAPGPVPVPEVAAMPATAAPPAGDAVPRAASTAASTAEGRIGAAPEPPAAQPVAEDEEPLSAVAARAAAAVEPEPVRAAAHGSPGHETDAAVLQGFLAECVAEHLAASTARIETGMDRLRQNQARIRGVLQDTDVLPELHDGADLDVEMDSAAAVEMSVRREANAIADVAKRLASFSSLANGEADRAMVDVNTCVDEVLAATGAHDLATVATRLGEVPEIFASKTDLRLLLTKIIENSVHAVEGLADRHGSIKIDTVRRADEILITVIDNGAGIAAERRSKIFRPFYTSRDGAMGLGLTLAGHLVKKYEGALKVNSLPGQGTVTRISLPAGLPGP